MPDVDVLAILRPDEWNIPLFLHVLGAMVATGALVLALVYLARAWNGGEAGMFRASYKALLWGAIPGYVVMRVAAQWIYAKENWDDVDPEPGWIGIGFAVADLGLLFLLIATITAGVSSRKSQGGNTASKAATLLTGFLIIAYVVSVWAMTTKPA